MSEVSRPSMTPRDPLTWLWLVAGALLLPFTALQTEMPIAAWLAPIFLIRFARTQRPSVGLPLVAVASVAALSYAGRDIVPLNATLLFGAFFGLAYTLPYVVDRLLAARLGGLTGPLVYPAAVTTVSLILSLVGPTGTWAAPAYSQYGLLPLVQLVSLTGIWGLTFLIAWGASTVNAVWEAGFDGRLVRAGAGLFVAVLLAVLLFGSARLAFAPATGPTVRVAALAPDESVPYTFKFVAVASGSAAERAAVRPELAATLDDLFTRSQREARAGAAIVSWSEAAAIILAEDEAAVLERARTLARQEGITLQLGLIVIRATDHFPFGENRAIMIDPSGAVVQDYAKTFHPLGDAERFAPGPGWVPVTASAAGRLATVICYDMDFPALVRQAGQARADLLLVPASDWAPIKFSHAQLATFRAVENGATLVRATRQGLQIAVDHQGRVLASADSLATNPSTMVAVVPSQGVWTLYPIIGDSVGYLAGLGLLVLTSLAVRPARRRRSIAHRPVIATH